MTDIMYWGCPWKTRYDLLKTWDGQKLSLLFLGDFD